MPESHGAKGKPLVRAGRKATDLVVEEAGLPPGSTLVGPWMAVGTWDLAKTQSTPRRIHASQAASRAQEEKGFTLIELFVVILIIGILAAIAIPSFLNQKGKANDAAAKELARTSQTAAETYSTDHNGTTPAWTPRRSTRLSRRSRRPRVATTLT